MTIPAGLFGAALWICLGAIAVTTTWLLATLVREWRRGSLW